MNCGIIKLFFESRQIKVEDKGLVMGLKYEIHIPYTSMYQGNQSEVKYTE